MRVLPLLPVIACLLVKARGKIFSRCELVFTLEQAGLEGYQGYTLGDWVCLAFFSSGFNTAKVTENSDGSTEYGIFQINSRSWCSDHHSTTKDLCDISCRDLLTDEITADIDCLKKAVVDSEGLDAWSPFGSHYLWLEEDNITGVYGETGNHDEILGLLECSWHYGVKNWNGWRDHCRGRNLYYWINGCNIA